MYYGVSIAFFKFALLAVVANVTLMQLFKFACGKEHGTDSKQQPY